VAFPVCDWLTFSFGFKALHWNRLVLAGDQIDRAIDITQIPNFPVPAGTVATGLNRPTVFFNQTDLWLRATNVGVELKWSASGRRPRSGAAPRQTRLASATMSSPLHLL